MFTVLLIYFFSFFIFHLLTGISIMNHDFFIFATSQLAHCEVAIR